jgi:hypothetical protein
MVGLSMEQKEKKHGMMGVFLIGREKSLLQWQEIARRYVHWSPTHTDGQPSLHYWTRTPMERG